MRATIRQFFATRPALHDTVMMHAERLISGVGGLLGILAVSLVSAYGLDAQGAAMLIASMGASAVLLFAVPHGPLSQPWPVIGGHTVSALIGVATFHFVGNIVVAGAVAVGLAIGVMYYLRCLHPPGGATALTAVIGGEAVHQLGYHFVLMPVAANAVIIVLCAIAVNYPFTWRRYPARWQRHRHADVKTIAGTKLTHEDFAYALRELESFIDVSEEDLERIFTLATAHAELPHMAPDDIRLDGYYSNGRYGEEWSVRHVVDQSLRGDPEKDQVIYRVVAGKDRRAAGVATRAEFARWARHEVVRNENSWQKREYVRMKEEEVRARK